MTAAILILLVLIVWTPFVAMTVEHDTTYPRKKFWWSTRFILIWFAPMFAGMSLIDIIFEGKLSEDVKDIWRFWWVAIVEGRNSDL
jgi:hypothetical protein